MEGKGVVLPVIDLHDFPNKSKELVQACKELGCFRIVNHGIPSTLMSEMKRVVRSLLDLPAEIKQRNKDAIPGSGYVAPNAGNPLYEALGLYDLGSSQAVQDFCDQLDASPQQREIIFSYSRALNELVMDLWCKLVKSMGVENDSWEGWKCQFRINKYNFSQETVGSSGVQVHTDSGFLTLLQEDDCVSGLEIMPRSSSVSSTFLPVHHVPGTLLVNLGDMATAWSNDMLYNVKHRVQCKEAATRVSIALFLLGPKDVVEAPSEFIDANHPRLYPPFSYEEYRLVRLSTGLRAGEALDRMKLTSNSK